VVSAPDDADLRLGPLRLRIRTSSPLLRETLTRFLPEGMVPSPIPAPWGTPAPLETRVFLETFREPLRRRRTRVREGALCQGHWRRGERSLWVLEGEGLSEARAWLHAGSPDTAQAALRQCLRGFLPEWFLCQGGIVLHGATLIHRHRAWVFLAQSGGGKTTLARHHGDEGCLGDDAAFLWHDAGTDRWWAVPSPLPGREPVAITAPPMPVAGLFRLRKGQGPRGHCGQRLQTARALREVLARARVDVHLASVRGLLLDRALDLVRALPVRVIRLPRDQSPWPLVDQESEEADGSERR